MVDRYNLLDTLEGTTIIVFRGLSRLFFWLLEVPSL